MGRSDTSPPDHSNQTALSCFLFVVWFIACWTDFWGVTKRSFFPLPSVGPYSLSAFIEIKRSMFRSSGGNTQR